LRKAQGQPLPGYAARFDATQAAMKASEPDGSAASAGRVTHTAVQAGNRYPGILNGAATHSVLRQRTPFSYFTGMRLKQQAILTRTASLLRPASLERRIYFIRGHKVMTDTDPAVLYRVPTKVFNQAVRRNSERFPVDFMFQLTPEETENLRSQIVTSSWGGRRYLPLVFTEQGVAMLSSVLKSERAIQVTSRSCALS